MDVMLDKFGRVVPINCYESEISVNVDDLVIANTNEFSLTEGKVYRVTGSYGDIRVSNDSGEEVWYSSEYFDKYQGQKVADY